MDDSGRRRFLEYLTATVGGAGMAATSIPFISSMNPGADVLSKATTEVNLSGIALGDVHTVPWQGKPVFVFHRTESEIKAMESSNGGFDPEPDKQRVKNAEWLVVVGICTHMGCVPNKEDPGWICHCHGSQYDDSGRVVRGPAPKNLEVPAYRFLRSDLIEIGAA